MSKMRHSLVGFPENKIAAVTVKFPAVISAIYGCEVHFISCALKQLMFTVNRV